MSRRTLAGRGIIIGFLILQIIPLLLFPLQSFSTSSQEWWLPVLLAFMVILGDLQVILRGGTQLWPWHLFSFSHGFNVISRLMMLWPHATHIVDGATVLNGPYVALTCISMAFSGYLLWYFELPDVRLGLVR
jgi:hypothetical protein